MKLPEGLNLTETEEGLTLTDGKLALTGDFTEMLPRIRRGNLESELLVKAVKIKGYGGPLTVLDATAGMGQDSLLLAAAGCTVSLYEKDEVISALLSDCLKRSASVPGLSELVGRMTLFGTDSIEAMKGLSETGGGPDVIYLDPMFPGRTKSGLIKKKFQLLQQLERPCGDEEELLLAAVSANPRKIVIKRPLKGPFLAGRKPDYQVTGKAIRYDVIVNASRMPKKDTKNI